MKFSVNDFIIKAATMACLKVPESNAIFEKDQIKYYHDVDLNFAVEIEDGLITPIIKKAHIKTLSQISQESKNLIDKAKSMKLQLDEFQGGTFTISNLGNFGVESFTSIINPPQSCILAISKTSSKAI